MPSMANITVKKNDGTTDITYTAQAPAAGDRSPAIWQSTTVGSAAGHRPELRLTARSNAAGTVRRLDASFVYRQVATDTGTTITSVVNSLPISLSVARPVDMPDADVNEAISQAMNLFASTLFKDSCKSGFSPS